MIKLGTLAAVLLVSVFSLGFADPASTKYADVKVVFDKAGPAVEKAAIDMEKATDAKSVAIAIKEFSAAMVELISRMNEFVKIYPELTNGSQAPKELEETSGRFGAAQERYQLASKAKLAKYENNAVVSKALADMQKAMAAVQ